MSLLFMTAKIIIYFVMTTLWHVFLWKWNLHTCFKLYEQRKPATRKTEKL